MADTFIDVIFDGPPGHDAGRFVECEDASGESVNAGEWIQRDDGLWALRIRALTPPPAHGDREALEEILDNPKYVSFYMRREDRGRLADAILAAGFKRGR